MDTWNEEWRIETEAHGVLSISKVQRDELFSGRKDADGRSIDRGVVGVWGVKAADEIKATVERLQAARAEQK